MLASHERSRRAARGHREPAGQIAAREMDLVRLKGALQRAEELSDGVAAAIQTGSLESDNCRLSASEDQHGGRTWRWFVQKLQSTPATRSISAKAILQ